MGSEFVQRRAAAAASNKPGTNTSGGGTNLTSLGSAGKSTTGGGSAFGLSSSGGGGGGKKSFADIQREQEREARRGSGPPRGGGGAGGTGRDGGGPPQQRQPQPRPARVLQRPAGDDRPRPSDRDHNPRGPSRRSSHRPSQPSPRSTLPLEQGSVHTLLDKFGFIMCADRDAELFFHYSQYRSGHSDDLNVGDEVEFRVGHSDDRNRRRREDEGEKLCALEVRTLPKGTIAWETEDQPGKRWRGQVERAAREDHRRRDGGRGGGSAAGGAIRLLDDHDEDEEEGGDGTKTKAETEGEGGDKAPPVDVHYRPADFQSANQRGPSRLERRDVVEFDLFTERRTGRKFARHISLVQSERERLHHEREAKLMESATLEQGRVVRERGDRGVLQSVSRAEEVHFHVSHVVDGPHKKGAEGGGAEKRGGLVADVRALSVLREGQEVEFYVVDEGRLGSGGGGNSGGGGGGRPRNGPQGLSARKIQLLPPGTVQFEHRLAAGVTGRVVACPVPAAPGGFGRRDGRDRRSAPDASAKATTMGTVRLAKPLQTEDGTQVTEAFLAPDDYPGGSFHLSRTGGEQGIWIRPGDVLLFDVVRKVVDGSCHAVPTACLSAKLEEGAASEPTAPDAPDAPKAAKAAVRLVDLSLLGRAEGTIKSVQDAFGFVTLAERSADAYFPLFEVFPAEMQGDLARGGAAAKSDDDEDGGMDATKGGRVDIKVGTEVSFDLAVQPPDPRRGGGGGGRHGRPGSQADKESYRARRLRLLPAGTVLAKIPVAAEAKATVAKVDSRQPFAGTLELESPIERSDPLAGRHPLLARLLEDVAHGRYGEEGATFPEALGEADARTVVNMVDARDDLRWGYVGEEGAEDDPSKRRLCISRKAVEEEAAVAEGAEGAEKAEAADEEDAAADASSTAANAAPNTKTKNAPKVVRTVRYDKSSFPDLSSGPLGVGDVVTCDVVQLRRSGALLAANLAVVDRKAPAVAVGADGAAGAESGVGVTGVVAEVVPARGFGFIAAVDAEGRRGDHVFFHFNELAAVAATGGDDAPDAPSSLSAAAGGKGKKGARSDTATTIVISKGDEVKFDVAPGKNGKLCATNITLLPRGTLKLPPKADAPPSCTGYVLLEPSRTPLSHTPARHRATSSGPAVAKEGGRGRWDNVRDETAVGKAGAHAKEDGILLLLTDPGHLFSPKPERAETVAAEVSDGAVEKESGTGDVSADTSKASAPSADATDVDADAKKDAPPAPSAAGIHLRYKLNALVGRGRPEPRRGDLVTFGKTRGAPIVKEVRVETAAAATNVRGVLAELDVEKGTAVFVSAEKEKERYEIGLDEVVSCDRALLKEQEQVDGILHEGKIFGVCRTKDIFLASSISKYSSGGSSAAGGGPAKERTRLNLTVKKGLGGQIMAQSRMAKGPDGTTGFVKGWTTRVSEYIVEEEEEAEEEAEEGEMAEEDPARALSSLSLSAAEFVPTVATATSGFESTDE